MTDSTFVQLNCVFKTDVAFSGIMRATWEKIFQQMVHALQMPHEGKKFEEV